MSQWTRINVRGLTLVEILAAMAVMVIGISAVTLMLLTGTRFSRSSLERNAATMIVAEAIPEIERRHLITESMDRSTLPFVLSPSPEHLGLLIETVDNNQPLGASTCPDIHDVDYKDVKISATMTHGNAFELKCFETMPPDQIHMSMWPMPPSELPKTYGSLQVLRPGDTSPHGTPLRVLYRLERHQDWHAHTIDAAGVATYPLPEVEDSPFRGVYVLTLTIYKDPRRDGSTLEQVTDPYVVFLNDKKVR